MDEDHKDLLRRLFVVATERLEVAHDAAVAGQSAPLSADDAARAANAIQIAAEDVVRLARAMAVLLGRGADDHHGDPEE